MWLSRSVLSTIGGPGRGLTQRRSDRRKLASSVPSSAALRSYRRLRVAVVVLAAAVVGLSAGLAVVASSGGTSPGHSHAARKASRSSASTRASRTTASTSGRDASHRPQVLVGVTTGGTLEALSPLTGAPSRVLASGATGDEVSVTPDGSMVYFEAAVGCMDQIERVPVAGGSAQVVATGSVPAVSPDGAELAYVRQPLAGNPACQGQSFSPSQYTLVVRNIASGAETTYPVAPQVASNGVPSPVDHLSWSADGRALLVSIEASQDNQGWQLSVIHPTTDEYYFSGSGVPVASTDAPSSYYREGVLMPNGDLFVDLVCCSGTPPQVSSDLLVEVDPSTGSVLHQVAVGITTNDHTSLETDASGHWLLYLSGNDLLVSEDGKRPTTLASGFVAAGW